MHRFRKWISMLCMVCILHLVIVTPLLAAENDGLLFPYSPAKKLATDIQFWKTNYPILVEKNNICEQQLILKDKSIDTCYKLNDSYILDKQDLAKVSEDFKKKYTDTSARLVECKESQPSRLTWYGLGAGSALLLSLVAAFMLRK